MQTKLHAREPGDPVAARRQYWAGRRENAMSGKPLMHGGGESYSGVVPTKQPNKGGRPSAEVVEERPLVEENTEQPNPRWTQNWESGPSGLERVREAAKKDGKVRFTALLHHVTVDLLRTDMGA
jgi:RNA-directed DNA polymerase